MTTSPKQPATGSVLVTVAALHVLLAQHPHLAALPLAWQFDEKDGIFVRLPYLHPETVGIACQLAAALGVEPREGRTVEHEGLRSRAYYVETTLSGVKVFAAGHAPVVELSEGGA